MDWKKLISDIEATGLTQEEIATQCGVSQPYISQLKGGARLSVGYEIGTAIRELHARLCKIKVVPEPEKRRPLRPSS